MPTKLPTINFINPQTTTSKPLVAISSCLMGNAVRYDGKHQLLASKNLLSSQLTLLPLCPEVGAGMPVPRPAIQLVKHDGQLSARGRDNNTLDVTAALDNFRQHSLSKHSALLCGYIFKGRSPSCGLNSTPIHSIEGKKIGLGSGMQAHYVQQQWPWLVVTEGENLNSQQACQRFIWLCKLLFDLRSGCENKGLAHMHLHLSPQILALPEATQQQLKKLSYGPATQYWQVFISAMAQLTEQHQ